MNYPLISEYISSILSAEDNLATKTSLRPVLDSTGTPIMSSGNFAVVFKMIDTEDNKHYAMKCFLREQIGREESYLRICEELEFVESRYLLKTLYLPGELFVDTNQSDETEFPVLLMEWVDGCTLGSYISDNFTDSFKISQVAYNFSKMASWLLSQDFAHGDIKPDNIIVKDNGNLVLVDYDGMYVPSMKGNSSRENGSPNFRHPNRAEQIFDEHIDDFALSVLNLTLKVLSLNFDAFPTILANDYCIFSEGDYNVIHKAKGLNYITSQLKDVELQKIWGVFLIALSENKLSSLSFRLVNLALPSKDGNYSKLTELSDDENKRTKEKGIVVDNSGKRLIAANVSGTVLDIPDGLEMICRASLQSSKYLNIVLPDSIKAIGGIAFANNESLESINIPRNLVFMEHNNPFGGCINLKNLKVDSPLFVIDDNCLYSIDYQILYASLFAGNGDVVIVHPETRMISGNSFWLRQVKKIILPDGLSVICGSGAFGRCHSLIEINIPDSVIEIGSSSFYECSSLESISIPDSVKKLGPRIETGHRRGMFEDCGKLTSISLPNHIEYLGELFFKKCASLKYVNLPKSIREIGARSFEGCKSLEEISIPENVQIIRSRVFCSCESLKSIYIPDTVLVFDEPNPDSEATNLSDFSSFFEAAIFGLGMFSNCTSLETVRLPQGIKTIKNNCFHNCTSLLRVLIPSTVSEIENKAFSHCEKLSSINLPEQLQIIHKQAFAFCLGLETINLPSEMTSLQVCSFEGCTYLKSINLPPKITHLDGNPFPGCNSLHIEIQSDAFILSNSALYSFDKKVLHSFFGNDDCTSMVFDGVKHIDKYCFSRSNIETVTIPIHIYSIRDHAFSNCTRLKEVVLNGITEISSYTFDSCSSLINVSIPGSVSIIKEYSFHNCSSLKRIDLPDSIKIIEGNAFSGCRSLSSINLPKSLIEITHSNSGDGIFAYCENLSVVILNSYLPSIREFDFNNCKNLNKIIVPAGDKNKYRNKLGKYYSIIVEQYDGKDDLPF